MFSLLYRQHMESDQFWRQGGQTVQATNNSAGVLLPPSDTVDDELVATGTVAELVSTIHSSLDSKLNSVMQQLSGIENRMTSLETRQQTLEQEVRYSSTLSSSPGGSDTSGSTKRKRVTPVELQVNGFHFCN